MDLPSDSTIAIANAPCSYGAFEFTVGIDPNVPDGPGVLDRVAEAGYSGIDLGPVGYLGTTPELAERLRQRGLSLAGGYLPLPFSDPLALADEIGQVDAMLDVFQAVAGEGPPPRPTLGDAGSPLRFANPGVAATDRSVGLDENGWSRFADGLARVVDKCRTRGYEPTFHHHTATYVEAVWEIERVLELSDVGLCFDTGHIILGGGDPVTGLNDWGERINHLHVKDAQRAILDAIVAERAPVEEIWRRRAFCAFGLGDIPIDEVIAAARGLGYHGWLVVEQDIFPDPADGDRPGRDQVANREFLRARGL